MELVQERKNQGRELKSRKSVKYEKSPGAKLDYNKVESSIVGVTLRFTKGHIKFVKGYYTRHLILHVKRGGLAMLNPGTLARHIAVSK